MNDEDAELDDRILAALNTEPMTPKDLADHVGEPFDRVMHRVDELLSGAFLRWSDSAPGRLMIVKRPV